MGPFGAEGLWLVLSAGELGARPRRDDRGLRQLHSVRLDLLMTLARSGRRRGRLLSPYREHLAKHFADTFSRIGLLEPYDTKF